MNKIVRIITIAFLSFVMCFASFACSCSKPDGKILVIAPDGAPALALGSLMADEDLKDDINFKIIDSTTLSNYIPKKTADIAIVPLNSATMWCGNDYKIVSVNTHGNLYIIGKGEMTDLNSLIGKKVACIQYANVPGLTFRTILEENQIPYVQLGDVNSEIDSTKVNIIGCTPNDVGGFINTGKVDFAVNAEPAVTVLTTRFPAIQIKASLQELYKNTFNEEYPQAVTIVKTELIKDYPNFVKKLIKKMQENDSYLTADNIPNILTNIENNCEEDYQTTLDATKLTATSLTNCNVKYVDAKSIKTQIFNYIERVRNIDSSKINVITEDIFYSIEK